MNGIVFDIKQLDVVFVPLVVFDLLGHRIGYGNGFYDRFLAQCLPETLKIGLSFFYPVQKIDGIYSGDISLDFCVSPDKVYTF